jgi:inorganic pyrophosphatase
MSKLLMDPISKLMGLRYKSHPWHGVDIGPDAPVVVTCFIEMVPTDTVKYELDKKTGYLKIDRPQKYSNVVPALYGFIPQTFCGERVAELCRERTGREGIRGDGDPLDICVFTEKEITHGDLLVKAKTIGGFRMIDGEEADDKIIAVMNQDAVYGEYEDLSDCPALVIDRLMHYFLTYKDLPGTPRRCEITHTYGKEEARDIILRARDDYRRKFENLDEALKSV